MENNESILKVTILLLNYNGWKDAIECLESIYKLTYPNWEVVFVDNGSEDDSVLKIKEWTSGKLPVESKFFKYDTRNKPIEYIEEVFYDEKSGRFSVSEKVKEWNTLPSHKKLSILQIEKNLGFTGGSNIGLEYILNEKKPDYILILSNDTVLDSMFLDELVKVAESDKKIGIVGPKVYYYDTPNKIQIAGRKINYLTLTTIGTLPIKKLKLEINEIDKGQFDEVQEVDDIAACAFLIKREVINKIGMLDQQYFIYWEDFDFFARTKKAGYHLVYVPNAKLWRKSGLPTMGRPQALYFLTRNRFLFMKKNSTKLQMFLFMIWFFSVNFMLTTSIILIQYMDLHLLRAFYKAVYDGICLALKKNS